MSGTTYAITEILLFLAGATVLGFLLGRLTASRKPAVANTGRIEELEAQVVALQAQQSAAPPPATAMQKDLEVARWEIEALEEELARLRHGDEAEAPFEVLVEFEEADEATDVADESAPDDVASEVEDTDSADEGSETQAEADVAQESPDDSDDADKVLEEVTEI